MSQVAAVRDALWIGHGIRGCTMERRDREDLGPLSTRAACALVVARARSEERAARAVRGDAADVARQRAGRNIATTLSRLRGRRGCEPHRAQAYRSRCRIGRHGGDRCELDASGTQGRTRRRCDSRRCEPQRPSGAARHHERQDDPASRCLHHRSKCSPTNADVALARATRVTRGAARRRSRSP